MDYIDDEANEVADVDEKTDLTDFETMCVYRSDADISKKVPGPKRLRL